MNAIDARLRYRLRTLQNLGVVILSYIVLALMVAPFSFRWFVDIAGIGVFYFLFVYVLEQHVEGFQCPHCLKKIEAKTPWLCGVCGKANHDGLRFPFIHKCGNCNVEPKGYRCHHCSNLIFLSKDEQKTNYARCLNSPIEEAPTKAVETDADRRKTQKESVLHEIDMAELLSRLEAAKRRVELDRKRSPRERLEKNFEDNYTTNMGAREMAREKRAEADIKYKDDPEMRKAAHEAIDDWVRGQT
jgi:hypothetical protein